MNIIRKIFRLVKRKKTKWKRVIQRHHIRYADDPRGEWVVRMQKGEHWIICLMNRQKRVSKGFVLSVKDWLERNEMRAADV